ncbi:hypothetical protein COU54_04360 [Candidatus Pacearchaeota archaeon CG10_big_fil_rev_8_21_14_0_10_31_24]|nr:MAG: hypothetical protein COU54_04360 [Candidatus Pacearchaeota archaeon CG10_big_fil_rev_8_21_14_0_10_31_24]
MHSNDEKTRITCKNFFIEHLNKTIFMSLESVGKCDDIVWQFSRKVQDEYYPFMDRLHTIMNIKRIPYDSRTITKNKFPKTLSNFQQLILSQSQADRLFTLDKEMLNLNLKFVTSPNNHSTEKNFPGIMERFYKQSLKLRVNNIHSIY